MVFGLNASTVTFVAKTFDSFSHGLDFSKAICMAC